MKKIVILNKFNCQSFPLNDKAIEVSEEVLAQIGKTKCFDVENNRVIDYDNTDDLFAEKQQELRAKREPLLKAFDIYKTNVMYGLVDETDGEHLSITNWYRAILELDENAIENYPMKVGAYL